MALNCITAGINGCEIGPDLMNLLLAKKVDLILQGHDHNYQRSKQLSCAQVNQYDPSCIVNDGANGIYNKDAGSILVISGTGGSNEYDINTTRANYQYFARTMGPNTPGDGYGFTRFTITPNKVVAQTFFGGSFADTFAIVLPPTASFTYSPTTPLPIFPVTFTASATSGTQPYAFTWDFGDGSTGTGASTSHSYLLMRTYVVTLTVTDSTGQTARVSQTVTVSILGLNAFPLKVGSYQAGFG
jgi:PKD repeat protein